MAMTRSEIQTRYDAKNTRTFSFKFNRKYDADIIKRLESMDKKQQYIKRLIRDDIARAGSSPDTETVPDSASL